MIRKAWVLCCYTPLVRIHDFLVINFQEQWWFLWKDLTGISQLCLSSSPDFHIHPLQNKISICFCIVKICEAWNAFNINSNKFMFFFRVPKCVKSVILWMWIWLKDCRGEQSSLSFMKKTSQTDEESFSNYGSGSKYPEKETVPLHFWVCDGICEIDRWVLPLILYILNLVLFLLLLLLLLVDRFCCCCAWVAILHLWLKETSQPWAVH